MTKYVKKDEKIFFPFMYIYIKTKNRLKLDKT